MKVETVLSHRIVFNYFYIYRVNFDINVIPQFGPLHFFRRVPTVLQCQSLTLIYLHSVPLLRIVCVKERLHFCVICSIEQSYIV